MAQIDVERIGSLVRRLRKLGIELELSSNYPWLYMDKVNGKRVTERFMANHGFCIYFQSTRTDNGNWTDIGYMFKTIRTFL